MKTNNIANICGVLLLICNIVGTGQAADPELITILSEPDGVGGFTTPDVQQGTVFDGHLFFGLSTQTEGNELWRSDGTEAGTSLVANIVPGSNSFIPYSFLNLGNELIVAGSTNLGSIEQLVSVEAGTNMVDLLALVGTSMDLTSSLRFDFLRPFADGFVYVVFSQGFGPGAVTFFYHNMITDTRIQLSSSSSFGSFVTFTNLTDRELIFSEATGTNGVFRYNADTDTKVKISDLTALHMQGLGNQNLFIAKPSLYEVSLYKTDGTTEGTKLITPLPLGEVESVAQVDDAWLFTVFETLGVPKKLYRTDGTLQGTFVIENSDLIPQFPDSNRFDYTRAISRDRLYFKASGNDDAFELWSITDGVDGPAFIGDLIEAINLDLFELPLVLQEPEERIVFRTNKNGIETMAITSILGNSFSFPLLGASATITDVVPLGSLNDGFYFVGRTSELGTALYRIDLSETASTPAMLWGP